MVKDTVTVQISNEAEVRPIAMLVQIASKYHASIHIEEGNRNVNAKSIMGMMTLGLATGKNLTLIAEGEDEEEALSELVQYLSGK